MGRQNAEKTLLDLHMTLTALSVFGKGSKQAVASFERQLKQIIEEEQPETKQTDTRAQLAKLATFWQSLGAQVVS